MLLKPHRTRREDTENTENRSPSRIDTVVHPWALWASALCSLWFLCRSLTSVA